MIIILSIISLKYIYIEKIKMFYSKNFSLYDQQSNIFFSQFFLFKFSFLYFAYFSIIE